MSVVECLLSSLVFRLLILLTHASRFSNLSDCFLPPSLVIWSLVPGKKFLGYLTGTKYISKTYFQCWNPLISINSIDSSASTAQIIFDCNMQLAPGFPNWFDKQSWVKDLVNLCVLNLLIDHHLISQSGHCISKSFHNYISLFLCLKSFCVLSFLH